MSALTSLLVRDRVVPISKIEDALESQVLTGGDIDTVLLEMNAVPEDVLAAYRAALFGLLPATREEVMRAPHDAVRALTRDIAQRANIVPILLEGSSLVVAVSQPLSEDSMAALEATLKCELSMRVVTEPRLAAALHHYYGAEVDSRTRRLVDALRKRDPGIIPYVRPPSPSLKPSLTPRTLPAPPEEQDRELSVPMSVSIQPSAQFKLSEPSLMFGAGRDDGRSGAAFTTRPLGSSAGAAGTEASDGSSAARADSAERAFQAPNLGAVTRATTIPPSGLSARVARGARGPISRERASELLSSCENREDVLFVLLRYVQQFFDFVSVFSVGKDGVRGRLAHGIGLSPELMEHVVVPLDSQGLLGLTVRDKGPRVGDLSACDEERAAAALLGRPSGQPGIAVPILLRGRAVLVVYADRDGEGLSTEDAEVIVGLGSEVAAALKRLIVQRKALGGHGSVPPASTPPGAAGPADADPGGASAGSDHAGSAAPEAPPVAPQSEPPPSTADLAEKPRAPASDPGLTAVDLDAMVRTTTEIALPTGGSALGQSSKRAQRDAVRSQFPGVPRTAPPPPQNTTKLWQGPGGGAYSYTAPGGVQSETVRNLEGAGRGAATEPAVSSTVPLGSTAGQKRRLSLVEQLQEPSVIIDMGDQVTALVQALAEAEPGSEAPQIEELLRLGEGVLPVLSQHFPGRLWVKRESLARGELPSGRDVSAVSRAILRFGESAAPYVASLVANSEGDTVFYGLLLAAEVRSPDLLDPLARRAFDPDPGIRTLALQLLRGSSHMLRYPTIVRALCDLGSRPGRDAQRQLMALEAARALREPRAARCFLERLKDRDPVVVNLAHAALVELTAQDFGQTHRKWEQWLLDHEGEHRVEWLIESLCHGDSAVRAIAVDELQVVSQLYLGYHPALSKRERELIQRKYRDWWQREGRAVLSAGLREGHLP